MLARDRRKTDDGNLIRRSSVLLDGFKLQPINHNSRLLLKEYIASDDARNTNIVFCFVFVLRKSPRRNNKTERFDKKKFKNLRRVQRKIVIMRNKTTNFIHGNPDFHISDIPLNFIRHICIHTVKVCAISIRVNNNFLVFIFLYHLVIILKLKSEK